MAEAKTIDPRLVAQIVGRYVAHNTVAAEDLPNVIAIIHRTLAGLGQSVMPSASPKPAVAINRSYGRDFVACLDCGWRGQCFAGELRDSYFHEWRACADIKAAFPVVVDLCRRAGIESSGPPRGMRGAERRFPMLGR